MSDDARTITQVYRELVSNPFFPLLFISEAMKIAVVTLTDVAPVMAYTVLAVVASIMWAISDTVEIDINITDRGFLK